MILVVLFTLLLLAGILSATMGLGLSSRQNTADQAATLRAQYAAESGMALLQSRLSDVQTMLSSKSPSGTTPYLAPPSGVTITPSIVDNWAKLFCGQTTSQVAWTQDQSNPAIRKCDGLSSAGNQKFTVLANLVANAAYNTIPLGEQKNPAGKKVTDMTESERIAWWEEYLSDVNTNGIQYSVRPIRVTREGYDYTFYLGAAGIKSKADLNNSTRTLRASRTIIGDWWFRISVPNPFDNALMLNSWLKDDGGFYNDVIRGNLFVNEKIRFLFNINTSRFMGDIRSAGCKEGIPAPVSNADCSNKSPGFYGSYTNLISPGSGVNSEAAKNSDLKNKMIGQGATLDSNQPDPTDEDPNKMRSNVADFNAKYLPLPLTVDTQQSEASKSGLTVASGFETVEMYAGDQTERDFGESGSYNSTKSLWNEPDQTYQYISFKKYASSPTQVSKADYDAAVAASNYPANKAPSTSGKPTKYYIYQVTSSQEYRADKNGKLYQKSGSGWGTNPIKTGFNGVIFSDHRVTVSGPNRIGDSTTSDVGKMPPALASFSKINLTVKGGMDLNSDLTVSNTPCGFDNKLPGQGGVPGSLQPGCPKTGDNLPSNTLALYAPTGDITMTTTTKNEATYHSAILASQGTFNVRDYDKRPVQGNRHVVGAVVENRYGLNGVASLNGNNVKFTSGYGDDFSQDTRFRDLDNIPANPIDIRIWSVTDKRTGNATAPGLDDLTWQQGK